MQIRFIFACHRRFDSLRNQRSKLLGHVGSQSLFAGGTKRGSWGPRFPTGGPRCRRHLYFLRCRLPPAGWKVCFSVFTRQAAGCAKKPEGPRDWVEGKWGPFFLLPFALDFTKLPGAHKVQSPPGPPYLDPRAPLHLLPCSVTSPPLLGWWLSGGFPPSPQPPRGERLAPALTRRCWLCPSLVLRGTRESRPLPA